MNRPAAFRRVMLSTALLVVAQAAAAQTAAKPPPRLPPNASETVRIPAGVDSGSPATTDNLPLGTPVPPTPGADRGELRTRSAAARAAARPKLTASSADCTRRVDAADAAANGKAAPVALPKSGFTGSSTSPSPAASTATGRNATRIDC